MDQPAPISTRHPEVAAIAGAACVNLAACGPRRMHGPGRRPSRALRGHLRMTVKGLLAARFVCGAVRIWCPRHDHPAAATAPAARPRRRPPDHRRADAGDVSLGLGADHCRAGAGRDRAKPQRHREPVVGGHRLSPISNGRDAAVWQALRYLRPPLDDADCGRDLPRRLARLRAGAVDGRADRRPRAAGFWRRRHFAFGADRDRRHSDAAGAADLPELLVGDVHDGVDPRTAGRRLPHRLSALVVHLLDHAADGFRRAGDDRPRAEADPAQRPPAQARRHRRGADDRGGAGAVAGAVLGRGALSLELGHDRVAADRLAGAVGGLRLVAQARAGTSSRSRWSASR